MLFFRGFPVARACAIFFAAFGFSVIISSYAIKRENPGLFKKLVLFRDNTNVKNLLCFSFSMEEGVIEKILEEINQSIQVNEQDSLGFGEPDCIPLAFSADNFHSMPLQAVSDSKMIFIDGGNAEILSSPGFCVHFVRVFHTIYEDNVRVSCSSDEFYVLASAKNMDGKIFYSAKLFKSRSATLTDSFFATDFLFDSLDKDLFKQRKEKGSLYAKDYFYPVNNENMRPFLEI